MLRRIEINDLSQAYNLLNKYNLVTQDIDINKQYYSVIEQGETIIAIGGVEYYPPHALLRSIAVSSEHQSNGYARQLCDHLINHCMTKQIDRVYLLTESAQAYFINLGFEPLDRSQVPQSIKNSKQFSSLCPDDAAVLVKHLLF